MPNYVRNVLILDADISEINKLLDYIKGEIKFDFNKVLPMPEGKDIDWYNWCIKNWGTKWNALNIKIKDNRISFDTAWSAPLPIIEKLAKAFPKIMITHLSADEDMGVNTGYYLYQDGKNILFFMPDAESDDAYRLYEKCWGKSNCLKRDKDGNYERISCDDCCKCL